MESRKLQVVLALLMIVSVALVGCQPATPAPAEEEAAVEEDSSRYHLCVVHNNMDSQSITAVVQGMEDEAAVMDIKLTHFDPAMDPQKQVDMIDDCIALDPDVIVVNAVDPEAVVAAVKKAHDLDYPVVMCNADTTEEGRQFTETYVGASALVQGQEVGKAMARLLPDGARGVAVLGRPGQTDVVFRMQGVKESIAASGKDIQFLDEQPANWHPDEALTVMTNFLTRYPSGELDFVVGLDDPMALGALEAIKAVGREGEVMVFGFNGNKEACDAIKAGEFHGTALHLSYLVGVETVRACNDVMLGRLVPDFVAPPTTAITADSVDQWYSQCW